ncbi:MAG: hypothetical protein ACTHK7_19105 [Aureliella sp.]
MSESLAVLIDHAATREDAEAIGQAIIDALVAEGCILATPNSSCVLTGKGYPPGPRLNELYHSGERELRYWDTLTNCGVKVHAERYVDFWAFPIFEGAWCPACNARQSDDDRFFDELYACVAGFINEGSVSDIRCPSCDERFSGRQWICVPDVGLAYLGIEFWNWPPFSAPGWTTSVPELIAARTGRSLAISWGRM